MTRRLVYSRQAQNDLDAIFDFIASDSPRRALAHIEDIRRSCRGLIEAPKMGLERSDLRPGLRILPLWRRIVVAYELPRGRVDILRVFSGGQNYHAIMSGD